MYMNRRVVITGFGVLAANGIGENAFWNSLLEGKSGICRVTQFDPQGLPCQIAGEIKGFQPDKYIFRKLKPRRMGRFSQLAVAATLMAIEKSGFTLAQLQEDYSLPVILGVSTSAMDLIARKAQFFTASSAIPSAAASAITHELSLKTRLLTFSNACTSSTNAIEAAVDVIKHNQANLVLAGGTDSSIARYVYETIGQSGMLSSNNDHPEHASRPFDQNRDGGIIAEGAGMLVMESLDHAISRGAKIYGEITGYNDATDEFDKKDASGLETTMLRAIANAAQKTSTPLTRTGLAISIWIKTKQR